ncbi:hypothetical protein CIPAW_03G224600 [Carya illinoinensis]|uniref:Uncharacterized protein n=1 Tax=Carya illinoinensis TaxID=32201 RepID=A0A8T1R5N4_CARIL|nr:hypothetical protein CIPAW_03G224600 [Carya illinoinensis]
MDSNGTTQSVQPMFSGSQESVHPMIFYDWMTHNQSSLGGDGSNAWM